MHPTRQFRITKEELAAAYAECGTMLKVAKRYGVSKRLIHNRMREFGLTAHARTIEDALSTLREMAAAGEGIAEMGRAIGFSISAVKKAVTRHGIQVAPFHKGYVTTESGYIKRRVVEHPRADGKGYVGEHVLVMEEHLGRFLTLDEVVHHIDGDKTNNALSNLRLMTKSEHKSLHASIGDCGWGKHWHKKR